MTISEVKAKSNPQNLPKYSFVFQLCFGAVIWYLIYRSLKPAADWLAYSILNLSLATHLGSAVAFFLYEVPKVLLLLVIIVFGVGILRSFFSPEKSRKLLSGRREFLGSILAALLGVVTPFCSCSAVPLFIGFMEAGIPLGVTLAFLISAPMVNEVALILLFGLFGWKVALLYLLTGLLIAIISGLVIGRLKLERYVEEWVYQQKALTFSCREEKTTWRQRIEFGKIAVRDIVGRVWLYVIIGIAVGAGIHGYVPEGLLASFMGKSAWWSVPLAVLIGLPLYSNAAGIIPVIYALLEKGAALGTALAFMMSVIAISLPEAVILRKVLKIPLILIFFGIVTLGILIMGFLFNFIL